MIFDRIPEYEQILTELSRGNLSGNFSLANRRSKLSHSLSDILFGGEKNDELSFFILFMESKSLSSYVKFLLDLNTFKQAIGHEVTTIKSISLDRSNQDKYVSFPNQEYENQNDALSIFKKYISKDATYSIDLPDELITETISRICPEEDDPVSSDCFDPARDYILTILEKQYYDKYIVSEYHCKYIIGILKKQSLAISDILYDNLAIVYLLEYLELERTSEILKFWIQAENFSRTLLNFERKLKQDQSLLVKTDIQALFNQWQTDAMVIYDNFISLQANFRLGFDDLIRRQVELNICEVVLIDEMNKKDSQDELYHAINSYSNCFYLPMLIIYSLLEKVYFNRFLSSQLYLKYVNEVLNRAIITMSKSSSLSSDSSSSLSSSNSSLNKRTEAAGSIAKSSQLSPKASDTFNSTRPSLDKMQIGSIDSTGRFIPYLKHEPESDDTEVRSSEAANLPEVESTFDLNNIVHISRKSKMQKRLNKFLDLLPIGGRNRSRSKSNDATGYYSRVPAVGSDDEDEEKMAEKIAAMIVSDVMRTNQLHQ